YLVDAKALKTAVLGTSLTFNLYSDSACTAGVATQAINVENVNVLQQLKRITPKKAPKAPNTAQVTTVLKGVTASGTTFLTVTGTGITPVGEACQLQLASGIAVPPATPPPPLLFMGSTTDVQTGAGVAKWYAPVGLNSAAGGHPAFVEMPGPTTPALVHT